MSNDNKVAGLTMFGIEHLVETAGSKKKGSTLSTANALGYAETLLALNDAIDELGGIVTFADNTQVIASVLKESKGKIPDEVTALFGPSMSQFVNWNTENAKATSVSLESAITNLGDKISTGIRKVIERLRQFMEKVYYNKANLIAMFNKARQKLAAKKSFAWKKEKTFKVSTVETVSLRTNAIEAAKGVLNKLTAPEFKLSAKDYGTKYVNGTVVKELRAAFAKTEDYKCTGAVDKTQVDTIIDLIIVQIKDADALDQVRRLLKGLRVRKVKIAEKNEVSPGQAVSTASLILSLCSVQTLRSIRRNLAVLKNVK